MPNWNRGCTGVLWLGLALISIGCDSPDARQQIARREANLQRTFKMFQILEDRRPKKLERTLAGIENQQQRDIRKHERNMILLERWPHEEVRGWESRRPRREEGIREFFEGNPANIEKTWPLIVY